MTVVFGFHVVSALIVVADCRVSRASGRRDDNLRKLYQVGENVIFGFTGPVAAAREAIAFVKAELERRKAVHRRSPTALEVARLLRHAVKQDTAPLKFMVAGRHYGNRSVRVELHTNGAQENRLMRIPTLDVFAVSRRGINEWKPTPSAPVLVIGAENESAWINAQLGPRREKFFLFHRVLRRHAYCWKPSMSSVVDTRI